MKLTATALAGVWRIDVTAHEDERGAFLRTFCADTFRQHGLDARVAQCSLSTNRRRGTLRGLHYQAAPHEEAKLVRCTRGRIFDVALDLRRGSPSYRRWLGVELDGAGHSALYLPPGVAHGFLTLADDSDVFYQISIPYEEGAARAVRWDDGAFDIRWPFPPRVMSERDRSHPDYDPDG